MLQGPIWDGGLKFIVSNLPFVRHSPVALSCQGAGMERADGVLAEGSKKVRGKKLRTSLNLSWIRKKMKERTGRLGKSQKGQPAGNPDKIIK